MTQIVGSVLVRNEDVFVEQAIRNVAEFCDRIHAVDHVSSDRTWDDRFGRSRRSSTTSTSGGRGTRASRTACSSRMRAPTRGCSASTATSSTTRQDSRVSARDLLAGAHADVFRLKAHVLNCDELDDDAARRPAGSRRRRGRSRSSSTSAPSSRGRTVPTRSRPGTSSSSRASTGSRGATSRTSTTWETDPLRLPPRLLSAALERRTMAAPRLEPRRVAASTTAARSGRLKRLVRPAADRARRCRTGSTSGTRGASA